MPKCANCGGEMQNTEAGLVFNSFGAKPVLKALNLLPQ